MAPHSSTLAWKLPWTEEPGGLHAVHGVEKSQTRLNDFTFRSLFYFSSVVSRLGLKIIYMEVGDSTIQPACF